MTCVTDAHFAALIETVVPEDQRATLADGDVSVGADVVGPAAVLLEYHFVDRFVEDWVDALTAAGVPAEGVRDESWMNRDAFLEPEMLADGHVYAFDHPVHGGIRIVGDLVRMARQSPAARGRAPLHGEHTREVLAELGYDESRIEELLTSRAVAAAG